MCTQNNISKVTKSECKKQAHLLDKLELNTEFFLSKSHANLHKHCHTKAKSMHRNLTLHSVCDDPERRKNYRKAYHCSSEALERDGILYIGKCKKRHCIMCQHIQTNDLINAYLPSLKALQEEAPLFMVTLTAKNIKATSPKALRDEIRLYNKEFTRIKDNIRKTHSMTLNGFKKVECTHNENTDEYHPHLHLIIQGQAEAELVKAYWITQMKKRHGRNKVSNTGQKVVILGTEESDLVEVFKYATKGSVKDSEQAKAEDLMFGAIEGLQIFKPIGKVKRTKRTSEEGTAGIKADWIESKNQNFKWNTKQKDYLSKEGLPLVGTQAIDELIEIKATININVNYQANGRKTIQSGSGQRNYSISSIPNGSSNVFIQSNG
jgi:hypothetical protein